MKLRQAATRGLDIVRWDASGAQPVHDDVVVEEPLQVWLEQAGRRRSLGITMRTPGHDEELARGLLYAESIVEPRHIEAVDHTPMPGDEQEYNSVRVQVSKEAGDIADLRQRERAASSACGICGRETIEDLRQRSQPLTSRRAIEADLVRRLPSALRARQDVFAATGGLHAAALVDHAGVVKALREDVGRHNAVDKVVGRALMDGLDMTRCALAVSGRAGFEIVQKAIRAGVPVVAAVGAPSSLAVEAARAYDLTLIGFLREDRFNVYAGAQRVRAAGPRQTSGSRQR